MLLYPAIDLKDGRCVRLVEGRMDDATIFNEDPSEQAVRFQTAGFPWIHVVDLDGAIEGEQRNAGAIAAILACAVVPVQVGGGVRTMSAVSYCLDAGVSRVVIGTAALKNPAFVREAAREWPERIAVALDARDEKIAVSGWVEQSEILAVDLAARFADIGVAALIVTDIRRDGLKTGVNVDLAGQIADAVPIPVIASGGARSVADIAALKARQGKRPIHGVILGRALYEGDINPAEALAIAVA
ncbi:MAG: 1-(5-phosphoribosyl)-5-[(5-phosphoribosylamino)methylideneamino]imidazole-4-carboxamide isomerase [Alphaproteobacteria bacterium]|jgi:phosphoribosylformimino-5-aminoimidazole carboxamide ribotide isomerase|nr:1-(5-phosphoribosyl)-5-[(5-phosphoribosylamino)methylideneamino]imidazole-4-carboxamide isomerase [Alphaproteobacteria bacterium]